MNDDMGMESRQLWHLLWIGVLAVVSMGIALWWSPWIFDSVDDPEALYRYAIIKFPQAIATIFILLGSVCLADIVFPGDILRKVVNDAKACAIVIAALFIAVGYTLA